MLVHPLAGLGDIGMRYVDDLCLDVLQNFVVEVLRQEAVVSHVVTEAWQGVR